MIKIRWKSFKNLKNVDTIPRNPKKTIPEFEQFVNI